MEFSTKIEGVAIGRLVALEGSGRARVETPEQGRADEPDQRHDQRDVAAFHQRVTVSLHQ